MKRANRLVAFGVAMALALPLTLSQSTAATDKATAPPKIDLKGKQRLIVIDSGQTADRIYEYLSDGALNYTDGDEVKDDALAAPSRLAVFHACGSSSTVSQQVGLLVPLLIGWLADAIANFADKKLQDQVNSYA